MDEVIIEIPKRKIKLKAKTISEAILKLSQLDENKLFKPKKIAQEFAGLFKGSNYKVRKADWYKQ